MLKLNYFRSLAKVLNTFVESLFAMKNFVLAVAFLVLPFCTLSQEKLNRTDAAGMKTGRWISRYPNGTLRYEGSFDKDKPVGAWKRYHENGKVKALMNHRFNSERVFASLYDAEGKLYAKGVFEGVLRDSTWNFYSGEQLVMTENYRNGQREGKATGYYQNGAIKYEKNWREDLANGNSVEYDLTGIKRREIYYVDDKKNGPALFYDENGAKSMEGEYKEDLSEGTWKIFDKEGQVKYQIKYLKGEILDKGAMDAQQIKEFKQYDQLKGKIPEPKANETGLP
jgi:antitoxin component YwqK of YwqJK toxin-antitoxin module